jgi:hypothetical protein
VQILRARGAVATMSFSFGFEDDDDIETTDAEMNDAPAVVASTVPAKTGEQKVPSAETAKSHNLKELVWTTTSEARIFMGLTIA